MKRFLFPLLGALLLTLPSACAPTSSAGQEPGATALVVRKGPLKQRVVLTGELSAARGEAITVPRLQSAWETSIRWLIEDGTVVKKGERVVDLDNSSVTSSLEQKRTALKTASHQLLESKARLDADQAEKRFAVDHALAELQKARLAAAVPQVVLSPKQFRDNALSLERAQNEFEKARSTLAAAERGGAADLATARLELEAAKRDVEVAERSISGLSLTAPSDGLALIGEIPWQGRKMQVGDRVWVGLPIVMIPDLKSMQVAATLWDVDDGKVKVGDRVSVAMDAYLDKEFSGVVTTVTPVAQELVRQSTRRAFRVLIRLDRLDTSIMRPGYSVAVTIDKVIKPSALLVPRGALEFQLASARVRTADGKMRVVTLGPCNSTSCVVEKGVAEGERLQPVESEVNR